MTKKPPNTDDKGNTRAVDIGAPLTQSMENHLKAIFAVLEKNDRASTSAVAREIGVAPPSVTAMVRRLAELGLVTHERYQGVQLTAVGRRTALEIVRHHRLLELYLAEALGVPWDRVHDEAERLEHAISEDVEERIDAVLGNPTVDPHGSPIPARDGTLLRSTAWTLGDATEGAVLVVAEVDDGSPELLRYLAELGMFPGVRVEVLHIDPFNGPLRVRVDRREFVIGRAAAREVRVRTAEEGSN